MSTIVSLLLTAAVGVFVAWPFLRPRAFDGIGDADLPPLEQQKLEAYRAIKEAEFDLQMGKLSEADFARTEEKYRRQALTAIAAIEETKRRERVDKKGSEGRRLRRIAFCPACGHKVPPRANFCGDCGRSVREAVA